MSEGLQIFLGIIAFVAVIIAILVVPFFWFQSRVDKAIREATRRLSLKSLGVDQGQHYDDQRFETFGGDVHGIHVEIGRNLKYASVHGGHYGVAAVPINYIAVIARIPKPAKDLIFIRRRGHAEPRAFQVGDKDFDATCHVTSDNESAAKELLASEKLRRALGQFVDRGQLPNSAAELYDDRVILKLFNVHYSGVDGILKAVREVTELARLFGEENQNRA